MDDDLREQLGNAGDRLDRGVDHTTDTGKEAWRRSDGDDSLADRWATLATNGAATSPVTARPVPPLPSDEAPGPRELRR